MGKTICCQAPAVDAGFSPNPWLLSLTTARLVLPVGAVADSITPLGWGHAHPWGSTLDQGAETVVLYCRERETQPRGCTSAQLARSFPLGWSKASAVAPKPGGGREPSLQEMDCSVLCIKALMQLIGFWSLASPEWSGTIKLPERSQLCTGKVLTLRKGGGEWVPQLCTFVV